MSTIEKPLSAKDYASDQDVRWCPGCGDYSILKQMQSVLADLALPKEEVVFISGIGCSSRFPYYMNTYGMHSVHGRAPAVASGLKAARPDLNVWVITGDGDALSIGGNHLVHALRRNFDINILLFNNEIYGLTKGQYSPTSPVNTVTKSTPMGSIDHPFNPLALAMGADATFVARAMDRDPKHLRNILVESYHHKGTSLLEIYQNCPVFNDMAFGTFTEKSTKADSVIFLEHGAPVVFGAEEDKGMILDGLTPKVVSLADGYSKDDLWVHDKHDRTKATLLTRMFDDPTKEGGMPRPFGVFYAEERPTYEVAMYDQVATATSTQAADLDALFSGNHTWEIE